MRVYDNNAFNKLSICEDNRGTSLQNITNCYLWLDLIMHLSLGIEIPHVSPNVWLGNLTKFYVLLNWRNLENSRFRQFVNWWKWFEHSIWYVQNSDGIMSAMAFQTTGASIVYSIVCSGEDQRNHQSSASLAFVRGIPVPDDFPAQKPSNAENFSIWWRHHSTLAALVGLLSWCPILRSSHRGSLGDRVPVNFINERFWNKSNWPHKVQSTAGCMSHSSGPSLQWRHNEHDGVS